MECGLALALECDDNKTNKDVDHEECNDDKIDEIKEEDVGTVVKLRTDVRLVGVDGDIQNPANLSMK